MKDLTKDYLQIVIIDIVNYWYYYGAKNPKEMREKKPSSLLKKAIQGMLPKNRLGRVLAGNFRIYDDNKHPHAAQNPETISI